MCSLSLCTFQSFQFLVKCQIILCNNIQQPLLPLCQWPKLDCWDLPSWCRYWNATLHVSPAPLAGASVAQQQCYQNISFIRCQLPGCLVPGAWLVRDQAIIPRPEQAVKLERPRWITLPGSNSAPARLQPRVAKPSKYKGKARKAISGLFLLNPLPPVLVEV